MSCQEEAHSQQPHVSLGTLAPLLRARTLWDAWTSQTARMLFDADLWDAPCILLTADVPQARCQAQVVLGERGSLCTCSQGLCSSEIMICKF